MAADKKEILKKIAKISRELEYFKKDAVAPAGGEKKYSYTKGFDIAFAIKTALEDNNMMSSFTINTNKDGGVVVGNFNVICLDSWQDADISVSIPTLTSKDLRFYGSQFSYLKRLCMMAMFNIIFDEMDISDIEFAKEPVLDAEKIEKVNKWVKDAPNTDREGVLLRHFKVSELSELKMRDWQQIQSYIGGGQNG